MDVSIILKVIWVSQLALLLVSFMKHIIPALETKDW